MGDAPNELEVLEARREILQLEIALAQEDRDPLRETLIENLKETPNLNSWDSASWQANTVILAVEPCSSAPRG